MRPVWMLSLVGATMALAVWPAAAQMSMGGMAVLKTENIDALFKDAGPALPGARMAVLQGDLAQAGPFTMRLQFPANFSVAPHFHPNLEHVTVISGSLSIGLGNLFNAAAMQTLTAGGFFVVQAGVPHYASTTTPTVIQIHGSGPWSITYVNPQDDPRLQQK